jgi:hypothetical protein
MTSKGRVFVVNIPLARDRATGAMVPAHDISDAYRYGAVVHLLPSSAESRPFDPAPVIAILERKLGDFDLDRGDYLVAGLGHPLPLAWAAAIVARRCNGCIPLLYWHSRTRTYLPVTAELAAA